MAILRGQSKKMEKENGVGVFTLIPASTAAAIKREASSHKKPQWKLLRSCIEYGFPVAIRRGF
jgi:Na+-driven multidrug efflux pump